MCQWEFPLTNPLIIRKVLLDVVKGCSDEEIIESDGAKQEGLVAVKRFNI